MTSRVIHALQLRSEGDKSIVRTPSATTASKRPRKLVPACPSIRRHRSCFGRIAGAPSRQR